MTRLQPRLVVASFSACFLLMVALVAVFQRLEANREGWLTTPEYRQIVQLRQGGPGFGGLGPMAKAGLARKGTTPAPRPAPRPVAQGPITAEQARFFETRIRPVLM